MHIEKVWNGYIVDSPAFGREVYKTIGEVMQRMLGHFEGLGDWKSGEFYGRVIIERQPPAPTDGKEATQGDTK